MNQHYQNNQHNQPKPFQQQNKPQNAAEPMGFDKYVAIALVVGLIAGFVIGHSVGSSKTKEGNNASSTNSMIYGENEDSDNSSVNNTPVLNGVDEEIKVSDQKEGNYVIVSKLVLNEGYWVAVRDSQSTTKIPYILGAKRVAAGSYDDLSIYVNRATEAGKKYDIVFYKDGASFNYDASMLVMNGSTVAAATFQAE